MRNVNAFVIAMLALLVPHACCVAAVPSVDAKVDPRLSKTLSYIKGSAHIGELLDAWSKESGVRLEAGGPNNFAEDQRVIACLPRFQLIDGMEALRSLMSYRGAEWYWLRTGRAGAYRYLLVEPQVAREFADSWELRVQAEFEKHAATMFAAAAMSPKSREKFAERDDIVRACLSSPDIWEGLEAVAETLSREQLLKVLRGETKVRQKVSDLGPKGKAFIAGQLERAGNRDALGGKLPDGEPSWIEFRTYRADSKAAPSLQIVLEPLATTSYLGGTPLDNQMKSRLAEEWIVPGDARRDLAEEKLIPIPSPLPADPVSIDVIHRGGDEPAIRNPDPHAVEKRLVEFGSASGVPLLARLPSTQPDRYGRPYGRTIAAELAILSNRQPEQDHKWRNGVLLLATRNWFRPEQRAVRIPWLVLKRVGQLYEEREGKLSLEDMGDLGSALTQGQLEGLSPDFPVLAGIARYRDLFALKAAKPTLWHQLCAEAGAPFEEISPHLREDLVAGPQASATIAGVRLQIRDEEVDGKPTRRVTIGAWSANGRLLGGRVFRYKLPEKPGPQAPG